jgi:hypothetical protein
MVVIVENKKQTCLLALYQMIKSGGITALGSDSGSVSLSLSTGPALTGRSVLV